MPPTKGLGQVEQSCQWPWGGDSDKGTLQQPTWLRWAAVDAATHSAGPPRHHNRVSPATLLCSSGDS